MERDVRLLEFLKAHHQRIGGVFFHLGGKGIMEGGGGDGEKVHTNR